MNYIFDFDGTLADSLPAFIAVFNKTVRDNKNPLTAEEIHTLRNMTLKKAIKHLGIRWWKVPRLIVQGIPDFHALVPKLKPFKGVPEILKQLEERGDKLFIVTSNTRESVDVFLEKNKLTDYFTDIYTNAGLFNKSKYIRKLIKKNHLKRKDCVYIGDEVRDIKAARLAVIKIASVSWGFNDKELLKKHYPTYLIDKPSQLMNLPKKRSKAKNATT
jgi:phosphoglycolate phosphatase-like HAD superfamily hydrolase